MHIINIIIYFKLTYIYYIYLHIHLSIHLYIYLYLLISLYDIIYDQFECGWSMDA